MRTYMIYLLLTGKRLLRQLPCFLAGLAVMVLPVPGKVAKVLAWRHFRRLWFYMGKHL